MAPANYEKEYVRKTKKSRAHYAKARQLLPSGVESNVRFFEPYPFYVKKAQGPYLWDIDGNRIIDYALGYGPMILGHNHPSVKRAVKEQLERGVLFGASPDQAVE